jgi:hypothetical protein
MTLPTGVVAPSDLVLTPKAAWADIDSEITPLPKLFTGYVMILAAIGPICMAIGTLLFGLGGLGAFFHPNPISILATAIASYVLTLASVFVLGLIIEALAPQFGGVKSRSQAMKVAAYTGTASWLAGIFSLLPQLSALHFLGLYSLYLLYLGLPQLMKAPQEKALAYTAVVLVIALVLGVLIGALTAPLYAFGRLGGL